jgi:hypothetical protein
MIGHKYKSIYFASQPIRKQGKADKFPVKGAVFIGCDAPYKAAMSGTRDELHNYL